jgi:hypothetical protein
VELRRDEDTSGNNLNHSDEDVEAVFRACHEAGCAGMQGALQFSSAFEWLWRTAGSLFVCRTSPTLAGQPGGRRRQPTSVTGWLLTQVESTLVPYFYGYSVLSNK